MNNKMKYTYEQQLQDKKIVNYIDSKRINLTQSDKDIGAKIEFLTKEMGWKSLRVGSNSDYNKYCPIYNCSVDRITSVVKRTYFQAKRRLSQDVDDIQPEFNFENNILQLEQQRLDALSRQDSVKYFQLCEELGIEPEDDLLYIQGMGFNGFYNKEIEEQTE